MLSKLSAKLQLTFAEREALAARVRVLASSVHAEHGKRSLRAGDIAEAQARFARAAEEQAGWKIKAIPLGPAIRPGSDATGLPDQDPPALGRRREHHARPRWKAALHFERDRGNITLLRRSRFDTGTSPGPATLVLARGYTTASGKSRRRHGADASLLAPFVLLPASSFQLPPPPRARLVLLT